MYRMVIVDDDEIEREGMTNFIPWESYGIEIVGSAWNGQEGYEVICAQKPDLVITDIKMPVMNGIELIRKVKEENEEILFVVLSGYGEYEYTSQAMELGIRHYVLKPCDEKRIVTILEQAKKELEEARRKKELENRKYERNFKSMFTKAKEQFFHDALLSDVVRETEFAFYREVGGGDRGKSQASLRADSRGERLSSSVCYSEYYRRTSGAIRDFQDFHRK